jgi:DNA polymerase-1
MILAVDAHNLIWRAFHALKSVGCRRKLIVANVLSMIDTCLDVIDAEHGVVAFDSVCHARAEIFPGYKAANETRRAEEDPKLRDERLAATERLKDVIFPACGFQTILAKGFEADDILASIAQNCDGMKVTILSSDEDLWQCVREGRVSTIKIKDGGKFLAGMAEAKLKQEFGLTPRQWPLVLAAAGGHDGIPGVPGVGQKTAVAWVKGEASDRINAKMLEHRTEFRKYLKLVKLPLEGTPEFTLLGEPINRGAMLEFIRKYRNG